MHTATLRDIHGLIGTAIRGIAGPGELQILEAGCGRKWPIDLSGIDYRLTGLDLDADALQSRRLRVRDLHEAIVGDLCTYEFPPARFDVIYSAFVLEHVQGAERVLQKFVRWLKPGGLLVLQVPDRESVYGFFSRVTPFWFHVFYCKHFKAYYRQSGAAGQPGHGPYPTFHEKIISRSGFQRFAGKHGLVMRNVYGFRRLPPIQQKLSDVVASLSLGRLHSAHVDLCYVAQRAPVPAVASASEAPPRVLHAVS